MNQKSELAKKNCLPCKGGVPPLNDEEINKLLKELNLDSAVEDAKSRLNGWKVIDKHHLEKAYRFPDFRKALAFTNAVGELAEQENHHPDILLTYGKVILTLWTHKIGGLTESDFILAAKCDALF